MHFPHDYQCSERVPRAGEEGQGGLCLGSLTSLQMQLCTGEPAWPGSPTAPRSDLLIVSGDRLWPEQGGVLACQLSEV